MVKEKSLDNLKDKIVLITGGKGFLGRNLISQLRKLCKKIYIYNKDIRDINNFKKKSDIVFHLAAFNKIDSKHKPYLLFDVNVNGTMAVMHYCYRVGARCLFASSSAIYKPTLRKIRISEEANISPITLYGISKMLAEKVCRHYSERFKVSVISLRIFNMYGPKQQLPFIIPNIFQQLQNGRLVLLESPHAVRDFIYVSDIARAFILSCNIGETIFLPLNIGTGFGLRIENLVKLFTSRLKINNYQIKRIGNKNLEKDYVVADTRKARELLGWRSQVGIKKGLDLIIGAKK